MVSITCKGANCSNIISNIPRNSYGHNSVFARMLEINTKCLSIGLGPNWTPFIHYLDYLVIQSLDMTSYSMEKLN